MSDWTPAKDERVIVRGRWPGVVKEPDADGRGGPLVVFDQGSAGIVELGEVTPEGPPPAESHPPLPPREDPY